MLDLLHRPRLVRQGVVACALIGCAMAMLLTMQLRLQEQSEAARVQASLDQLAGLLRDVAAHGEPRAILALVRGWLHTETGVVRVTVREGTGPLLADLAHTPGPQLQSTHEFVVAVAGRDLLHVRVVMDGEASARERAGLVQEHVSEGIVLCAVAWVVLLFAAARRAAVRRYRVLLATSRLLLSGENEQELLRRLCALAVSEGGFALAWIGLVDADGKVTPSASAGPAVGYLASLSMTADADDPHGQGVGGRALRTREAAFCNDFAADPSMAPWAAAARAHGIRSSVGVPLQRGSELIGLLSLYSRERDFFSSDEIALIVQMAADIALGIEYLRHASRLAETLERLGRIEARVHAGSFRLRIPEGSLWCSDGAAGLFGRPPGVSVVATPAESANDSDPAAALWDLAAGASGEVESDVPLVAEQTPVRWLRVTGAVEPLDGGGAEIRGLVQDVSERKSLEVGVTRAADAERQRIASELHDNLGQVLTGTSMLVTSLEARAVIGQPPAASDLRQVSELLQRSLRVCRTLAHGTTPDLVHGLGAALEDLARQTSAAGTACIATVSPEARALHGEQAIELYRIAQEAVTNALKHANCRMITIGLGREGRLLELVVADDGQGLGQSSADGEGMGLRTMRYRAARAGGTIRFLSAPGSGLAVEVRVRAPRAVPAKGARA
jgi:signal transduction histidine kinase